MLQVHQRLGEFEIVRLLGKGGMGEVYEAQQGSPRRRVALKVLAPWLAQNEDALRRFWREAEVPAQLNHPGIVRIISTGQTEGLAYYTMHLVQGVSLAGMMRRARDVSPPTVSHMGSVETPSAGAPLPSPEVSGGLPPLEQTPPLVRAYQEDRYRTLARIGVMVARALAHAHSRGCVHRDLKPANIMVDQHDQAYVMDFGLTRALEPDGITSNLGTVAGTPWYMSPEQARGETVEHTSDIYSLGVTLYEMATGGGGPYACNRDSREAVLAQVRGGPCLPLRAQAQDIPRALEAVILKAMSFRVERRYADAGQLAGDLERYLEQTPSSRPEVVQPPRRRWARPVLLGGALTLLAAGALAAVFAGGSPGTGGPAADAGGQQKAAEETGDGGPADYPNHLRNRMWQVPQALFTLDHKPVWHRQLAGSGKFHRRPFQLILSSPPLDDNPTLLALDDDPARRWFEFTTELTAPLEELGKGRIGVFFGWRKDTARFFVVEIDEHPVEFCPHGRARIGTLRIIPGRGSEAPITDFRWLPLEKGQIPLTQSRAWHRLTVRVVDQGIAVTVDGKKTTHFTVDWLAQNQADTAVALNPRGALGIWAWQGIFCSFRNPSVTALPAGEKGSEK